MNDITRIAFVTRRFEELKGLQPAAFGAGLLFAAWSIHFLSTSTGYPTDPFQTAMMATLSMGLAMQLLEPRYRDTFGRIRPERFSAAAFVSAPTMAVTVGLLVDLISRGHNQWPSSAGIGLALTSTAVLLRDGRWRIHHLVPLAAGLTAAILTAAVSPANYVPSYEPDPRRGAAFLLAYAILGFGMLVAGLFDHGLLVRALTPPRAELRVTALARARSGVMSAQIAAITSVGALTTLAFASPLLGMVWPLLISVTFAFATVPLAIVRIRRWRRPAAAVPARPFALDDQTVVLMLCVALAALLDTGHADAGPIATAVAFGAASLWIAVRDWPFRKHYLAGTAASVWTLLMIPRTMPARAFLMFVAAAALALALENALDARFETTHADTI